MVEQYVCRISAAKDLLYENVFQLQHEFTEKLENCCGGSVVLDLSQVELIDSMGLKLVIGLYRSCQGKALPFQVEGCSPRVLQILSICGLRKYINITEK